MSWELLRVALHHFGTQMLWEALGFWSLACVVIFAAIAGGMRHRSGRARIAVFVSLVLVFLIAHAGWCFVEFLDVPGVAPHAAAFAAIVGLGLPGVVALALGGLFLLVLWRTHIPVVR